MTTIEDQWAIAGHHEAGHCVGYLHFGLRCGRVKIYETDDGKIVGSVLSPAGIYDPFARAIICMWGPLAEERLTGVSLDEQPGAYTDIVMAKEALSRVDIDKVELLDSILPFTKLMIDHEWPHIQQIAIELVRQRQLDYEQVLKIIQSAA
jgi:hypothetical protein